MTAPQPEPDQAPGFNIPELAASQFSYHVRMTAVFALAGESTESASEAVLAWTMLMHQWPEAEDAAGRAAAELIDQRVASLSEASRTAALSRAQGLALDIEAHYVSVGCTGEATLYAEVAEKLEEAIAALVPQ
jgi:hypothetical protein